MTHTSRLSYGKQCRILYIPAKKKAEGKGEVKVCLLIGHKSYYYKYTPIQIGSYIFPALQKQANGRPLILVISILLYHGKEKWEYQTLAGLFNYLEEGWQQFCPILPTFTLTLAT